jgi:hypothetical protein
MALQRGIVGLIVEIPRGDDGCVVAFRLADAAVPVTQVSPAVARYPAEYSSPSPGPPERKCQ